MANAAALKGTQPFRGFVAGYPGTAKTGAIAALANAGFKVRMLDYDGNPDSLLQFLDERALPNVDIVQLQDELRNSGKYMEAVGIPQAYNRGLELMKHWKYTDENGEEVDLGSSKDWGSDTVVVVDSLTTMGDAAFNRVLKACNRTPMNCTRQIWGVAMADQEGFITALKSPKNKFHLIVLCHLKLIGPEDVEETDDDTTKENKAKVAQIVPFRLYPWALGQKLSPKIGGRLPTLIHAKSVMKANKVKRVLSLVPEESIDVKVPCKGLPDELPVETGLLTIFEAMGHKAPGWA